MFGVLLKIVKLSDVLAPNMHLNINGGWAIRTWVGVFLTLVWVGLAAYCTIQQILEFMDTTNPFVAIEAKINSVYPSIDVVKNKHLPIFFAFAGTATPLSAAEIPSYFTVKFRQITYTISSNGIDFDYTVKFMPSIPCQALIDNGMLNKADFGDLQSFANSVPTHGICADTRGFNNLTVAGSFSDNFEQFIGVELYPCSLADTTQCKTREELAYVMIQLLKPAVGMDLGNKESPIKYNFNGDDCYYLNPDSYQVINQPLVVNQIVDSNGFLIPDKVVVEYTTYGVPTYMASWRDSTVLTTTESDIENFLVYAYFKYEVISGGKFNKITRTYTGFLDYLGNIGGIYSILLGTFGAIYYFYHYEAEKAAIVHAIYGLKAGSKNGCCSKKKSSQSKNQVGSTKHSDFMRAMSSKSGTTHQIDPETDAYAEKGTIYVSSKVVDKAFDTIKSNLDLVTICREINTIRCLASILMRDYHKGLVPLVSLSKYLQEDQYKAMKSKIKPNSCYKYLSQVASDLPLDDQEIDIKEGMNTLVKHMEKLENYQKETQTNGNTWNLSSGQVKPEKDELDDLHVDQVLEDHCASLKDIEKDMNNQFYVALANVSTLIGVEDIVPESPLSRRGYTFTDKGPQMTIPPNKIEIQMMERNAPTPDNKVMENSINFTKKPARSVKVVKPKTVKP